MATRHIVAVNDDQDHSLLKTVFGKSLKRDCGFVVFNEDLARIGSSYCGTNLWRKADMDDEDDVRVLRYDNVVDFVTANDLLKVMV